MTIILYLFEWEQKEKYYIWDANVSYNSCVYHMDRVESLYMSFYSFIYTWVVNGVFR